MSHKITIKPSGREFWQEANEAVLDAALREEGCALPYGCRSGTCGTCMATVLSGQVAYPDGEAPPALSDQDQAAGKALLCQARPLSDLVVEAREIDAVRDIEVKTLPCRVIGMHQLSSDVMRLYLKLPTTERLQFLAGQYISVLLRDGRRRDFSLANPPHADEYLELHVRRIEGGEFTQFVFEQMRERAILRFQGPLGTFFLREDSQRPIIMLGGGTGFAPLKSILEHAFHVGTTRPMHLYWGARTRQDLYLHELPEAWLEKYPHFRYTPVLSEPSADDDWQGRVGWVHEAVIADYADLGAYEVYASGPPAMIDAAKLAFTAQGLPEEFLFYDSFDFSPDSEETPRGQAYP
ncbi:MAG: CDP-6-deoxy-delta-3,4-glucoseen reductase [Candidatus Competibacteraceae bacterium]|jgi:CDP-4-dehydro-6-deoxyglucose reductase|nr:CDP-6-deoxy-delta-3,4-glucoseen reductase [Candidatus Competibacteraceae bacterium]